MTKLDSIIDSSVSDFGQPDDIEKLQTLFDQLSSDDQKFFIMRAEQIGFERSNYGSTLTLADIQEFADRENAFEAKCVWEDEANVRDNDGLLGEIDFEEWYSFWKENRTAIENGSLRPDSDEINEEVEDDDFDELDDSSFGGKGHPDAF